MKTVLVTGSSRGIGKGIALQLGEAGYKVVLHCKTSIDAAQEVLEELNDCGCGGRILQFDVADRQLACDVLTADIDQFGTYYGAVCSAGLTCDGAFPSLSDDDWDSVIRTNLDGFYNVLHPLIMPMIRQKTAGRIVTIASTFGIVGNGGQVNYSAAEAGIIGASKALAIELAGRRITVNCIAPGVIENSLIEESDMDDVLKTVPMKRAGKIDEVAALAKFLMSEQSSYITRQVICVNGGMY